MKILSNLFVLSSSAILLATCLVARTSAEKVQIGVGDEICIAGYIMDYYCIERGTLLDNPRVRTLGAEGPVAHSVHCLIDVKSCYQSPFEVLMQLENSTEYGRAWRLGESYCALSALHVFDYFVDSDSEPRI